MELAIRKRSNCVVQNTNAHKWFVPGLDFTKLFLTSKKLLVQCLAKKCHSISPMIKTPNFMLKLTLFLQNLLAICQTLCNKKSLSSCVLKKSGMFFDEIDPWWIYYIIS